MPETDAAVIERLARIEVKLDLQAEDKKMQAASLAALASRVDRVERFMWLSLGIALASGGANVASLLG